MAILPTDIWILFTNYDIIAYFLNLASCSEHFISIKHRILTTFNKNKKINLNDCMPLTISDGNLQVRRHHLFFKIAITWAIFQLEGYLPCRNDLLKIIWSGSLINSGAISSILWLILSGPGIFSSSNLDTKLKYLFHSSHFLSSSYTISSKCSSLIVFRRGGIQLLPLLDLISIFIIFQ